MLCCISIAYFLFVEISTYVYSENVINVPLCPIASSLTARLWLLQVFLFCFCNLLSLISAAHTCGAIHGSTGTLPGAINSLGRLNKNGPNRLMCLKTRSPVGRPAWEGLGGPPLGAVSDVSKDSWHSQCALCLLLRV